MDTRIRSLNIAESEAGALASVCQQLIETYGATLVSLVAYGSSVAGGYEPGSRTSTWCWCWSGAGLGRSVRRPRF